MFHTSNAPVYDVAVVGGGFAGAAAAIAAARQGSKTVLLEQAGFLGGAAGNNLIFPYMGYWTQLDGSRFDLCRGIFAQINDRLTQMDALQFTCFHEEYLKVVLEQMALEAGVTLIYHATVTDVQRQGRQLTGLTYHCCGKTYALSAAMYIDATGDANLATAAGCRTQQGRAEDGLCQPMTLCFRLAGVDKAAFFRERADIDRLYKEWQAAGKISDPRENMLIFDYPVEGVLHFNTTRVIRLNPTDPTDLTKAEITARQQTLELVAFLRQNFSAFAEAQLVGSGHYIGVRESRRIVCEHTLTVEELKDCVKFEDAIAVGNYDVDIHNPAGSDTSHYYFPEGVWYTIPYRSLVVQDADNLLCAGRCIGCTHEAQASVRIMPICCCMGEAAGTAAALTANAANAAGQLPVASQTDPQLIRSRLTQAGAFVG